MKEEEEILRRTTIDMENKFTIYRNKITAAYNVAAASRPVEARKVIHLTS